MLRDLDRFYEQLARLRALPGQGKRLAEYTGRSLWPNRGLYFFFEPGEYRSMAATTPRVVRVGTHAVSVSSRSTLWGRLRAHRGNRNGGGNHRGSVFRRHVGDAVLAREGETSQTGGIGQTAERAIRLAERKLETLVSLHLGTMSILWVAISDDPGPCSLRARIERNAIALLSNQRAPADLRSADWLGRHSRRAAIADSGLWNVDCVDEQYDPQFIDWLDLAISAMGR
jgi:hypothetical protein